MSKNMNMKVAIRVKLLKNYESIQLKRSIIDVIDHNSLIFDPSESKREFYFHGKRQTCRDITIKENKNLSLTFDNVFDENAQNKDVFEKCMKPLVHSLMDGSNCLVLNYGATGAGKTHTMFGNDKERGIAYLTMEYVFFQLNKRLSMSKDWDYQIRVSYLEVYNEQVNDLLKKSKPLTLTDNLNGEVDIVGLSLKKVNTLKDMEKLLALGSRNRTKHLVNINSHSTQSHAIIQVHITMPNKLLNDSNIVKLNLTDLGGSERNISKEYCGTRDTKASSINKSILTLKNCLYRLADGSKNIPFKDSKLTKILESSFNIDCANVLLFNVSSSYVNFDDTYNTLLYAIRAQKIGKTTENNVLREHQATSQYIHLKPKSIFTTMSHEINTKNMPVKRSAVAQSVEIKPHKGSVQNKSAINQITELTRWYYEISTLYESMKTAVEGCSTTVSRHILLGFRMECKAETEKCYTLVQSDQSNGMANIRLKSILEEITKHTDISPKKINYWINRLQICHQQVSYLHKKVKESKYSVLLNEYIEVKENELKTIKCHQESMHKIKSNGIYVNRIEIYSYLSLWAKNIGNQLLQEHYIKLIKVNNECLSIKEFFEINLPLYKYYLTGSNSIISEKGCGRVPVIVQRNNIIL